MCELPSTLQELVPIKWVGTMTLNRNPTNYFAETEQVAFCTSNVVPGIDYSNDPMLQLRNFSYFDTQISRLGGVNFNALPINRSVCPFISTIRDGQHQPRIMAGPHYYPNRFETPNAATPHGKGQNYAHDEAAVAKATEVKEGHLTFAPYKVEGVRGRLRPARFDNHYSQAQLFWNSLDPIEQQHIIDAAIFELGRVRTLSWIASLHLHPATFRMLTFENLFFAFLVSSSIPSLHSATTVRSRG